MSANELDLIYDECLTRSTGGKVAMASGRAGPVRVQRER